MREMQKEGEGETERKEDGDKNERVGDTEIADRGSMKPPNLMLG